MSRSQSSDFSFSTSPQSVAPVLRVVHASSVGPGIAKSATLLGQNYEQPVRSEFTGYRHELGLTQEQAAFALGVSRNTVQRWELGKTTLPAWALRVFRQLVEVQRAGAA